MTRSVQAVRLLSVSVVALLLAAPALYGAANENRTLGSGWQFSQATDTHGVAVKPNWMPAKVPGDVFLDLLDNRKIPPPFYRDNEAKVQWVGESNWEYRTTVNISSEDFRRKNIDLVFDGLDTCAQVSLNGTSVLTSNNMFRTYRIEAKRYLNPGANHLLVVFQSPIRCAAKIAARDPWRPDTHTQEKSYIRKAAYQYGWDWSPRLLTSGVWQPVRLEAWDDARISNLFIRQLDVSKPVAHILAEVEIAAAKETPATVAVGYQIGGHRVHASLKTELHPGVNRVELPLTVEHPRLWYPAGYGGQPLYSFHAALKIGGEVEDARDVRTGLRSVVLLRQPDKWGRSFEFVVNGIPIFAKGANLVPFDSLPNRVTVEQIRDVLESAKDANMNMLRMWGGGYYETQQFYEICDELGLMVWQDFMFGNPWQPGTHSFKQNVAAEVKDQLLRLRNHPSIVLWCGNNEQESNFTQDTKHASPAAKVQMWQDYLTVFSGIIPTEVTKYAPEAAYWPSTPSGNYAETRARNYMQLEDGDDAAGNYEFGDAHDYSVWDSAPTLPKVPFSAEENRYYRFVSEYGFQSFPDMQTIDSYTLPKDRVSLGTPVMKSHEKSVAGPGTVNGYETIHAYMRQYYGEPKNLPSLVYASQVLQAEGLKTIAEHLRRDRPRTMGSLFWQLNDCWPGVTYSSIDYYGRWKALQYYARRFYAPLLVSGRVKDGILYVHAVSDKMNPITVTVRVRVMQFDGKPVSDKSKTVVLPALSAQIVMQLPVDRIAKGSSPAKAFAAMSLSVNGKQRSSNVIYFVPTSEVHLPTTHIQTALTGADGAYDLHLSSGMLARSVYVFFGENDVKFSDNYFDLLPGEPREIHLHSKSSLDELKRSMKILSLADAFVSRPSQKGYAWR